MDEVKKEKLLSILQKYKKIVVAFSGGVDSAVLARAAQLALGANCVAVTAWSELLPKAELSAAQTLAKQIGINHIVLPTPDLDNQAFVANDGKRCYYCKKARFEILTTWAQAAGFEWVAEGSNVDDFSDYRPGMQATKEIEQVVSPLLIAGLTKQDIRDLAKEWSLVVWNKPSAACLASRLCYGLEITAERLDQIEQAETIVRQYTTGQIRVRHHGDLARIEVEDPAVLLDSASVICNGLQQLGFTFVTVDLAGYRMGSNNAVLPDVKK